MSVIVFAITIACVIGGGKAYLNAVITVCEVVHGLELFVDDTDTGLVCPDLDILDVCGRLAHGLELGIDVCSSFNGRLRVELSYKGLSV